MTTVGSRKDDQGEVCSVQAEKPDKEAQLAISATRKLRLEDEQSNESLLPSGLCKGWGIVQSSFPYNYGVLMPHRTCEKVR